MSVVLLWENPEKVMSEPLAKRVEIFRVPADSNKGFSTSQKIAIESTATWGFHEDPEAHDPDAFEYLIEYVDGGGAVIATVNDRDIRKIIRPDDMMIVTYDSTDWMGLPDSGRVIEISNEDDGGSLYMHFVTNIDGVAKFPLKKGARVKIRVNNELKALDVVVPAKPEMTYRTLSCFGTKIDFDRRGWY